MGYFHKRKKLQKMMTLGGTGNTTCYSSFKRLYRRHLEGTVAPAMHNA